MPTINFQYNNVDIAESTKNKEGSPCPSQSWRVKVLKAKRQCWKAATTTKRSAWHPPFGSPNTLERAYPGETPWSLCHHPVPPTTDSVMKRTKDNTLVLTVGITASKLQIKQAVKNLYDNDVAKVTWYGLNERRCLAGSWLWSSGCCQQNWDNLNRAQLTNSKYIPSQH